MKAFSFQDSELFVPLRIGRTARETLQEFIDIDVTASDLTRILDNNQTYRDLFFRFVNQKTAKAEKPKPAVEVKDGQAAPVPEKEAPPSPTHRLIGLLGMLGSRNLILALRIHRLMNGKFPVTNEGQVDITAGDYLKYSLEAEDMFVRNNLAYSETAFAAGMYFDLSQRIHDRDNQLKKLEPYYKRTWQRATRTGIIAYLLAERLTGFTPKTALAGGMLAHGGKLHMAAFLLEQSYAEFEEALDMNGNIPPLGRYLLEQAKFSFTQELVGAHSLQYFDIFHHLAPVVARFREPYVLKGKDKSIYGLGVILNLADNMARSWKIPVDDKDPVFQEWSYPGLNSLRIRRSILIDVMKKAMSLK